MLRETAGDKDWTKLYALIRDRSRIQNISLDLLQLIHFHPARDSKSASVHSLLVGTAFSLWRAVFLVERVDEWDGVLANAETFLEKFIRHNAIGYMDDWNNRKWSFPYYVDNARYRLNEVTTIVPAFRARLEAFRHLGAIDEPLAEAKSLSLAFNTYCNALDEAVQLLREQPDVQDAEDKQEP